MHGDTDMQVAIQVAKTSTGLETNNIGPFTSVEEEAESIVRSASAMRGDSEANGGVAGGGRHLVLLQMTCRSALTFI